MSTSRVNFISSACSYAPTLYTLADFQNFLIQFLVTGFPQIPAQSLRVVDGVARVTTVEKNFASTPGVKFVIAGTGVLELDDRQEVDEVFLDGFSFKTTAANGNYTNGVTYSLSSLGWSLIQQDSERLLLRSGSGAVKDFQLLLHNVTSSGTSFKIASLGYDANNFDSFRSGLPNVAFDNYQTLPLNSHPNYISDKYIYWVYGDDAFITITATKRNEYGYSFFGANSVFCGGELKPPMGEHGSPIHFLFGASNRNTIPPLGSNTEDYKTRAINIPLNGVSSGASEHGILINRVGFNLSTSQRVFSLAATPIAYSSGLTRVGLESANRTSQIISKFYISDINRSSINGTIPGCFHLSAFVESLMHVPYVSRKIFIDNKIRNCLFIAVHGSTYSSSIVTGAVMLDLSGPIR